MGIRKQIKKTKKKAGKTLRLKLQSVEVKDNSIEDKVQIEKLSEISNDDEEPLVEVTAICGGTAYKMFLAPDERLFSRCSQEIYVDSWVQS